MAEEADLWWFFSGAYDADAGLRSSLGPLQSGLLSSQAPAGNASAEIDMVAALRGRAVLLRLRACQPATRATLRAVYGLSLLPPVLARRLRPFGRMGGVCLLTRALRTWARRGQHPGPLEALEALRLAAKKGHLAAVEAFASVQQEAEERVACACAEYQAKGYKPGRQAASRAMIGGWP